MLGLDVDAGDVGNGLLLVVVGSGWVPTEVDDEDISDRDATGFIKSFSEDTVGCDAFDEDPFADSTILMGMRRRLEGGKVVFAFYGPLTRHKTLTRNTYSILLRL